MMKITTYQPCYSCAISGIDYLGSCADAVDAMRQFCKTELGAGFHRYDTKSDVKTYNTLMSWYVFVAGPEEAGHGHSKNWVKYGTEFAAYIKKHRLGKVATCPPVLNKKFHANTTCQTWVWCPNQKHLETWWTQQQEQDKIEAAARLASKTAPVDVVL